jgi:predicted DNA-binding transcriptional regulator AlpA
MDRIIQQLPPYTVPHKVKEITGFFGRTKALELEATDPTFPKRIKLCDGHLTAWKTAELIAWIDSHAQ